MRSLPARKSAAIPTATRWWILLLATGCGGGGGGGGHGPGVPQAATLASLVVSVGALSPAFSPQTTHYLVGPGPLDATVTVTATTADAGATMELDAAPLVSGVASPPIPLPMGALTQARITVTAPDGVTRSDYFVVLSRVALVGVPTYVKPSNTGAGDAFGAAVAVSGDTMVVGAPHEDGGATGVGGSQGDGASDSGAAYVFVRTGNVWVQQAYLKASNTGAGDAFGTSVAISGDTVVVGAPLEDGAATAVDGPSDEGATDRGAAYVFVRNGVTWSEQAYLKAPYLGSMNVANPDHFGASVAVSGDTVAVGAPYEDGSSTGVGGDPSWSGQTADSGAVYVFDRTGTRWTAKAYVKASDTYIGDRFGSSVALSGDTLVVGSPAEDSSARGVNGNQFDLGAAGAGAAYVFLRTDGAWAQQAYLKASNTHQADSTDDLFGTAVAVSGDTILVGAPFEDSASPGVDGDQEDRSAPGSGAAYVFVRAAGAWTQQAYLKASNPGAGDQFGAAVALDGDMAVVGAPGEDGSGTGVVAGGDSGDGMPDSGAAYVFVRSGSSWAAGAYVKATNTGPGDRFGTSVAVASARIAVGAVGEASSSKGIGGGGGSNAAPQSGAVYEVR